MIDRFLSELLSHQSYYLVTHTRPDGDAIGSQLALGLFLEKLGKEVVMINSDMAPANLTWMPSSDRIEVFDKSINQRQRIDEADAIVVLDANSLDRLGDVAPLVKYSTAPRLLIDHHTNPEAVFSLKYSRETAASTAELVYELIAAHDASLIDEPIATALYTAIVTDTGSFRYSAVVPELHRTVADILERGNILPAPIHTAVYDNRSLSSLKLLSRALATIRLRFDGIIGYMTITQRMLNELDAASEEAEGFVNYVLSIDTVKAALLFLETSKGTKISFRSTGETHVNEWARSFGGGGHRNASGAFVKKPLNKAIKLVVEAAPRFIDITGEEELESDTLSAEDSSYLASLMDLKENKRET